MKNRYFLIFLLKICTVGIFILGGSISNAANGSKEQSKTEGVADKIKNLKYSVRVPTTIQGMDVIFTPPEGHHFNHKAPSKVEILSKGKIMAPKELKAEPSEVKAMFSERVTDCKIKSTLYLCDNKDTYCVPKKQEFDCKGIGLSATTDPVVATTTTSEVEVKEDQKDIVYLVDFKKSKKLLMIDFFGIWCPPCNLMDETVFSTSEFKKLESELQIIKVDADKPSAWALKAKYKIKGYPTLIFSRPDGEEVGRIVGSRRLKPFISEVRKMLKLKEHSLAEREKLAESDKNSDMAYDLGLYYLQKEEGSKALYYFMQASRRWSASDVRKNDLLSAQLMVQSQLTSDEEKQQYAKMLQKSIQWYPHTARAVERSLELVKVAQDLKDQNLKLEAHQSIIETSDWLLKFPKVLQQEEWTKADLYQARAESFEELGDLEKSKQSYKKAFDEYTESIKQAGLDEKTERGYNLERIYCLWKAGDFERASQYYESLEKKYADEFTFFYQHAHLLKEKKNYKEALIKADQAFKNSYGDNRLRSAGLMAELYKENNQKSEAIKLIDDVTTHFILPEDKNVRTYRYYTKLLDLKKKLSTGP